jgi:hypothetical protein
MDYGDDLEDNKGAKPSAMQADSPSKLPNAHLHAAHHIQVKTGTVHTLMRNPPVHIKDASDFEPLYPPQEFILEESLRREAERVAH